MKTSIIIISYNSAEHIAACLGSIEPLRERAEVIVLDNASTDGSAQVVEQAAPWARLIVSRENLGFAGGVNRAVNATNSETLALLNPDAVAHAGWLDALQRRLEDQQVGVVGSKILEPDGNHIQSVGSQIEEPLCLPSHIGAGQLDKGQLDEVREVGTVHGAAMAFRRAVWQQVDGFDEGYFPAYLEESDFCRRVSLAGWKVVVDPAAVVTHAEAASTGKESATFYYFFLRNRLRYATKWLGWERLWGEFRLLESQRLRETAPLDRQISRLVYGEGVPPFDPPSPEQRALVLGRAAALAGGQLPANAESQLATWAGRAGHEAALEEHQFSGSLAGRLRRAWNNVSTRWYVLPALHQQTRVNLALTRALGALGPELAAQQATDALSIALLEHRTRSE